MGKYVKQIQKKVFDSTCSSQKYEWKMRNTRFKIVINDIVNISDALSSRHNDDDVLKNSNTETKTIHIFFYLKNGSWIWNEKDKKRGREYIYT